MKKDLLEDNEVLVKWIDVSDELPPLTTSKSYLVYTNVVFESLWLDGWGCNVGFF